MPFRIENWFTITVSGALFLSRMQGRGSRKSEDGSSVLASPSPRASLWKSRLKLPAAAPRPGLPKAAHPPATRERGRKLLDKFLIKLSFHGGDGGCSLMSSTTTPDQILFIGLSSPEEAEG